MEFYNHLKLNPILRYITLILFLACTARADTVLAPNYDDPVQGIKFFDVRVVKPLLLSCAHSTDYKIIWFKNSVEISKIKELDGHVEIHDKENKLIIPKPTVKDAGNYSCSIPELQTSAEIRAVANVYFHKVPDNLSVVEGERLEIHCKTYGSEPITVSWLIDGSEEFNRSHVTLKKDEDNVEDAILVIEKVVLEDRGLYNCTAMNAATRFNATIYPPAGESAFVRVKGKLAALWPFLGICAEVFILCAIILVYEKRRNKEGLDESDTDQSPEQEKLKTGK